MVMDAAKQIDKFKDFLDVEYLDEIHKHVGKGSKALAVDFLKLSKFDIKLSEELLDSPEETLKAVEVALDQMDVGISLKVRFFNLPEYQRIKIKDIRSEHLGKFISIDGIVRQASDVRPQVISAKFECPSCANTISILQIDTKFKEPSRCSCGRRSGFRLLNKELVDAQRIVLEESPETLQGGEQPKRLAIFLKEDLVEPKMEKKTTPGSKIRVAGIVKEVPLPSKTGGQLTRYDLVADCNFVESIEATFDDILLDDKDIKEIEELSKNPKIYEMWVNSIAPSIFGHLDIKEALVLQLMGGVKKSRKDGTMTRGDMHILLVGDPGAAKSTMLNYMVHAAPKSRYVAGRSASGAGITASVVRDEFLRGWALEAGALVLANKGYCMIDEMDKMTEEDTSALHEAMAQQQITISKANIQATLKAETTILAAANPKLGRFDPYQPIAAQINLPPALINRFDLIFPVRDKPDKKMDDKIASHVLELHRQVKEIKPEIPVDMIKKYVSYVKQHVFPKLTDGAIEEIKSFYVGLRNTGSVGDDAVKPIPITARQLEALVRLAEGSARVRLSNKVTKQDAKRAIGILKACLMAVGFDHETGMIDIDMMAGRMPSSQRNKIVVVRDIISKLASDGKTIPIDDVISESSDKGVTQDKVEDIIEQMKRDGSIFEPRRGFIGLIK